MLKETKKYLEEVSEHMTHICDRHKNCKECPLRVIGNECTHTKVIKSLNNIVREMNKQ